MSSSYLEPQEAINEDEIAKRLTSYPFYNEEDLYFKKFNETQILHESYYQVIDSLEKENLVMSPSELKPRIKYEGYQWTQTNNKISINYTFKSPNSNNLVTIKDDTITSASGFIVGRLYKTPKEVSINYSDLSVTIELTVNEPWPILITEGIPEIDPDSAFLLAIASKKLNFNSFSHRLFVYAAMKGHALSMASISYHYLSQSDEKMIFYWNVKLYLLQVTELTSFIAISDILIKQKDNGESAKLAEAILVNEAKKEVPIAFLYLGYIHLKNISGFNSNRNLAIRYFEIAAYQYNNKKAYETLGKIYIGGIFVEKDIEKGVELLHKANLSDDSINEILRIEKENREKSEKLRKESQMKTIIITSSVTLAVLASVFAGIEFFIHRSKK